MVDEFGKKATTGKRKGKLVGGSTAEQVDLKAFGLSGNETLEQISSTLGVGEGFARDIKRRGATGVTGASGKVGKLEQEAYDFRTKLPTEGDPIGASTQFFDKDRGLEIYAPGGKHFQLYSGGGLKIAEGGVPEGAGGTPSSSLFTQGYTGSPDNKKPIEGFKEEQFDIKPAEGKTIARTGQTGFNPKTGADVDVGEDEIFIEYTDGTFEIRKHDGLQTAGEVKSIEEAGKTIDELRADQGLPPLKEGGDNKVDNSGLEYIGKEYISENGEKRTAGDGEAFYQDPETRKILKRPDTGQDNSLQSTSPSILASRNDTTGMFEVVYGRKPNEEEAKYWDSRKDKSGAAIIGAMQFHKRQGKAIGASADGGGRAITSTDPIEAFNEKINLAQETNIRAYSQNNKLSGSSSVQEMLERLIETNESAPEPESLVDTYNKEMERVGFQEDAAELEETERVIKQLDADFYSMLEDEEQRPVSMTQIRRRQTADQVAYNRLRRDLVVERDYLATKVANKQAIVNTMVQLTGQDIANSQAAYQNEFNRAMSITNLIRGIEQDQLTQQQRQQDTARANVQIMANMLINGNMNYDDLDTNTRSQLANMEMQAGMPVGFTSFVSKAVAEPVTSFLPSYVDEGGNRIQPVGTINPNTGAFEIKNINQGKTDFSLAEQATQKAKSSGSGKISEAERLRTDYARTAVQLNARAGLDRYVSPEDFSQARNAWTSSGHTSGDFNQNFSYLVNPSHAHNYGGNFKTNKDTGIVEVVDYSS